MSEKVIAIILAGGKSSRMGQDKAMLRVDGAHLLLRVYQVAVACADNVYVVTPWQERYEDLLPVGCQFIREARYEGDDVKQVETHGPLIGFAQALAEVNVDPEWVLLLACDLPNLEVEVLQGWIEGLENSRAEAIAVLAKHEKGWEPLCGFYRKSCLLGLNKYISEGGRSFQQWLDQNTVDILPDCSTDMFFNCNTPEDLRRRLL
ncbi:molybdenum cofactor guanylyltransferase [Dulcicalothrix desertica PCC 7102]|uniref:Probable molybdenum cofactor guanylyltransferase n=1 Tax=Dulcicalothrix desertica PCC 7102 TaxID=232991 RepID=A0A433VAL9_9CYAN|nr:molybdenum cofactor guanylyltransferase [Dulcicalothrix desertica]RUT03113.1 molybdenum cofactor guanylyltransferase [Dulcicalothrix desertica PCC 7102]TWH53488.1 molybdopterin-guanine dinucleotide biosynthesis protein A [Dulcicalothrix desertica PCC 7102]